MEDAFCHSRLTYLACGAFEDMDGFSCQLARAGGIKGVAVFFSLQRVQERSANPAGPMRPEGISRHAFESRKQHLDQLGVRTGHEGVAPPERFELSTTRFEVCYSIH